MKHAYSILFYSLLIVLIYVFSDNTMYSTPDSIGYLLYAQAISSGSTIDNLQAFSLRTPLYPMAIAISSYFSTDTLRAVWLLHIFAAFCSISLTIYCLRSLLPYWLSGSVAIVNLLLFSMFFNFVLTEWITFCLINILITCLIRYFAFHDLRWLLWSALLGTISVLVRPAMIAIIPVLVLIAIQAPGMRRKCLSILFIIAPILTWMTFHCIRYGTFTVSNISALNLFGAVTVNAQAEALESDSEQLKMFIKEFNQLKYPRASAPQITKEEVIANLHMYSVAEEIRTKHGWNYTQLAKLCNKYSLRLIMTEPKAVFGRWWYDISTCYRYIGAEAFSLLILCACLFQQRKRGRETEKIKPFLKMLAALSGFFILHTALVMFMHPSIYRLFILSWISLMSAVWLTIASVFFASDHSN